MSRLLFRKVTLNEIHACHGNLTLATRRRNKTIEIVYFQQLVACLKTIAIGTVSPCPDIIKMFLHPAIIG